MAANAVLLAAPTDPAPTAAKSKTNESQFKKTQSKKASTKFKLDKEEMNNWRGQDTNLAMTTDRNSLANNILMRYQESLALKATKLLIHSYQEMSCDAFVTCDRMRLHAIACDRKPEKTLLDTTV